MASAPFTSDDFSRDKAKKISSFPNFLSKKFGKFRFFENFGSEVGRREHNDSRRLTTVVFS